MFILREREGHLRHKDTREEGQGNTDGKVRILQSYTEGQQMKKESRKSVLKFVKLASWFGALVS